MIRHLLAAAILASLLFGSSPVSAGPPAEVIALERVPPGPSFLVLIAVNRGVYTGATSGGAPFAFEVTFTYQHQGVSTTDIRSVPIDQTNLEGTLDNRTVIVKAFFTLSSSPNLDTPIETSATVVAGRSP